MSKTNRGRRANPSGRGSEASVVSLARGWLPAIAGLAIAIVAGLWFLGTMPTGGGGGKTETASAARPASSSSASTSASQTLPSFIRTAPSEVQEAYAFVAAHPTETQYMPCYCGCGEHSGHRWVRDCFVRNWSQTGITYDQHGSGCDICVNIALEVKNGLANGQSLTAIRKTIDAKYSNVGPGTDTPLPPT